MSITLTYYVGTEVTVINLIGHSWITRIFTCECWKLEIKMSALLASPQITCAFMATTLSKNDWERESGNWMVFSLILETLEILD